MNCRENSHLWNPAFLCLKYRTITFVLTILAVIYGIYAFYHLGRLSYPDFTIKKAMIVTHFPGASPKEMEELVTDVIEEAVQSIREIREITSQSQAGVSYVTVEILPTVREGELPQVWDFLRKKMRDIQGRLPYGCARPIVNDSFGDVYGIYYALTCNEEFARGKSQAQQLNWLKEQGRWLKKELLNIREAPDIARIDFYGVQKEVIHLEIPQSKLATQGIAPRRIMQELENQSLILDAGSVRIGNDFVRISPTGEFTTLESILNIVVSDSSGESVITLGDLVERDHLQRENQDPPTTLFRFNGRPAIAMGLSAKKDGNIVFMGEDIHEMLEELKTTQWPDGLELNVISNQAQEVTRTVNEFSVNLYKSLGIVMLLLFIFMGWRCGLILGFVLLLTILGTFIGMYFCGISLQIISLGALILALGMMVDNGIVILEEIIILRRQGFSQQLAAIKAVEKCQFPLLGATVIVILAFAAIGFAPDNIGEFCASLFQVVALALAMSWLTAVTILPFLCVYFLQEPKKEDGKAPNSALILSHVLPFFPFQWFSLILPLLPFRFRGPFWNSDWFFRMYRRIVETALKFRWGVLGMTGALLAVAVIGFTRIPSSFFGDSTRNQFYIDYYRAEGTAIEVTAEDTRKIEEFLLKTPGVQDTSTFIGSGSLRFVRNYEPHNPSSCFAQILITASDWREIPRIAGEVRKFIAENLPDGMPMVRCFREGPPVQYAVELQIRGREAEELRRLADVVKGTFCLTPETQELRDDWRQKVMALRPEIWEDAVKKAGFSRAEISRAVHTSLQGMTVGWFRLGEDNIPIQWRLPMAERTDVENLGSLQIYSSTLRSFLRLDQLAYNIANLEYEDPILHRVNRKPAITIQCNTNGIPASVLQKKFAEQLEKEKFQLPPGYEMEWRGEWEARRKGTVPLARNFPVCLLGMFLICVAMYNHLRQPTLIFLTVPFSVIGATLGLFLSGNTFDFLCIPGFLGLCGILIKNSIVLVTDTDHARRRKENSDWDAVVETAISRFRPVMLASGTTILAILPLLTDRFYGALAAVVVGGLFCGTLLILIVLPVLYAVAHGIEQEGKQKWKWFFPHKNPT